MNLLPDKPDTHSADSDVSTSLTLHVPSTGRFAALVVSNARGLVVAESSFYIFRVPEIVTVSDTLITLNVVSSELTKPVTPHNLTIVRTGISLEIRTFAAATARYSVRYDLLRDALQRGLMLICLVSDVEGGEVRDLAGQRPHPVYAHLILATGFTVTSGLYPPMLGAGSMLHGTSNADQLQLAVTRSPDAPDLTAPISQGQRIASLTFAFETP